MTKARLTARDLWAMGQGDVRRELVDGDVIEMAPADGAHSEITGKVAVRLIEHVGRQQA